jgi:hypothetical protein
MGHHAANCADTALEKSAPWAATTGILHSATPERRSDAMDSREFYI